MAGPACVVFDKTLTDYDFGPTHPMSPLRVDLTMRLADELGVLAAPGSAAGPGLLQVAAPIAPDDLIATVHTGDLIEAVQKMSRDPYNVDETHGLGSEDNPTFEGMHGAAAHIVGASVEAARQVWTGGVLHAANITGGLHHAMPGKSSGFCIYNDVAVAIRWLLANGAERVAYVDVDVHHGDGVERVFWDDPRVLTISLHETGQMLFPGTGFPHDVGGPDAEEQRAKRREPAGGRRARGDALGAGGGVDPPGRRLERRVDRQEGEQADRERHHRLHPRGRDAAHPGQPQHPDRDRDLRPAGELREDKAERVLVGISGAEGDLLFARGIERVEPDPDAAGWVIVLSTPLEDVEDNVALIRRQTLIAGAIALAASSAPLSAAHVRPAAIVLNVVLPASVYEKAGNAFYAAADFDNVVGQAKTQIFASYDGNRTWQDVSPRVAGESFPPLPTPRRRARKSPDSPRFPGKHARRGVSRRSRKAASGATASTPPHRRSPRVKPPAEEVRRLAVGADLARVAQWRVGPAHQRELLAGAQQQHVPDVLVGSALLHEVLVAVVEARHEAEVVHGGVCGGAGAEDGRVDDGVAGPAGGAEPVRVPELRGRRQQHDDHSQHGEQGGRVGQQVGGLSLLRGLALLRLNRNWEAAQEFDKIDKIILAQLQSNAQRPIVELAARAGLSPSSCHRTPTSPRWPRTTRRASPWTMPTSAESLSG